VVTNLNVFQILVNVIDKAFHEVFTAGELAVQIETVVEHFHAIDLSKLFTFDSFVFSVSGHVRSSIWSFLSVRKHVFRLANVTDGEIFQERLRFSAPVAEQAQFNSKNNYRKLTIPQMSNYHHSNCTTTVNTPNN
jgi:hypothetical protein